MIDKINEILKNEAHPFTILYKENDQAYNHVKLINKKLENHEDFLEDLKRLKELSIHYTKKGDLLYPFLKEKRITYDLTTMWNTDLDIRNSLLRLVKFPKLDENYLERLILTLDKVLEMVYLEKNILFPLLISNFTEEEWISIYQEMKEYKDVLGITKKIWDKAEIREDINLPLDGVIKLPRGNLTLNELIHILNTMPLEITFIDNNEKNKFFNERPKVFKRAKMALGREVFNCHPPKIEPVVRMIISDLKSGKKDYVDIWLEKDDKPMYLSYWAVKDKNNTYLGTLEIIQDLSFAKDHFEKIINLNKK